MADNLAVVSAPDTITFVDETPTKLPAPNTATDYEEQHRTPETIQIEENCVEARSKLRTLAIVAALYMVQFIAALDQTIIA